jgi:hypothetical protein
MMGKAAIMAVSVVRPSDDDVGASVECCGDLLSAS